MNNVIIEEEAIEKVHSFITQHCQHINMTESDRKKLVKSMYVCAKDLSYEICERINKIIDLSIWVFMSYVIFETLSSEKEDSNQQSRSLGEVVNTLFPEGQLKVQITHDEFDKVSAPLQVQHDDIVAMIERLYVHDICRRVAFFESCEERGISLQDTEYYRKRLNELNAQFQKRSDILPEFALEYPIGVELPWNDNLSCFHGKD